MILKANYTSNRVILSFEQTNTLIHDLLPLLNDGLKHDRWHLRETSWELAGISYFEFSTSNSVYQTVNRIVLWLLKAETVDDNCSRNPSTSGNFSKVLKGRDCFWSNKHFMSNPPHCVMFNCASFIDDISWKYFLAYWTRNSSRARNPKTFKHEHWVSIIDFQVNTKIIARSRTRTSRRHLHLSLNFLLQRNPT